MNFLTICKRVNDIAGFQGVVTSVTPTGYQAVLVQAVKDAYEDIQRFRTEWDFMHKKKSVNVSNATNYYSLADLWGAETPDLAVWRHVNYDYERLTEYSYEAYELVDQEDYEGGEPRFYSIDPATNGLYVSKLDQLYTLEIYYTSTFDELTTATQIPAIPERFHQAIVYGAVMKLATYVGNPTLFDTYARQYAEAMGQLMREQNPPKFVRKMPVA